MAKEKLNEPHCVRLPDWMDSWVREKAKDIKDSPATVIRLAICCAIMFESDEPNKPLENLEIRFNRALENVRSTRTHGYADSKYQ